MSYVNIEWDYNEVQSIISGLDRASTTLKNVSTPSTANMGAATEDFQCTDNEAADVMREIQRYNDVYTHRTPVRPSIGQMPAATSAASPR